ncbi:MAG: hypothetical protein P8123_11245 [bacterium]
MTTNKHFDLLANAQDSLAHAINHIVEDKTPSKWKIAVREVVHVIELMLKERLRQTHPAFLWVKVEHLNDPDKNTVTLDEAQIRLDKICHVRLPPDDNNTLTMCKKLRNQIEHFEFQLNEAEARPIVARLVSFIFSFTKQHLAVDWEDEFRRDDRWKALLEIEEFVEARVKVIQEHLERDSTSTTECPACYAPVFNLEAEECELCGHTESQIECFSCGEYVWEREVELVPVDVLGNENYICKGCIESSKYEDYMLDEHREE